jgi:sulfofructose kinase
VVSPSRESTRRVVFAGAAVLDAIALVGRFPLPDQRVVAEDVGDAGGGPAATAAVAAARLGLPVSFVGAVGDDEDGRSIIEGLRSESVDVSAVTVVAGARSARSVIVVDAGRGTRAICTRPGPPLKLTGPAARMLRSAAWVHVDHVGWHPVRAVLRGCDPGSAPRLSVDAGNPVDGLEPDGVELFVPTLDALTRRYGEREVDALLDAALTGGARHVVATRGSGGSVAASADGRRWSVPGHRVGVVSTLGAGDVFHGALLSAFARKMPMSDALRYANVAAALSCRALDGRSAIPTHEEVLDVLAADRFTRGEQ